MEQLPQHKELVITKKKIKVHKQSTRKDEKNIKLSFCGIIEEDVTLQGDLASIDVERYTIFKKGCSIKPPPIELNSAGKYLPVTIGSYSIIGENTISEAMSIGDYVNIGANCKIGARTIIKSCVTVLPNSSIPPDSILPTLTVYGNEGEYISDANECSKTIMTEKVNEYYEKYCNTFSF